jgi:hypothetical protein
LPKVASAANYLSPLHYRFCSLDCYCSADVMTLSVEKT